MQRAVFSKMATALIATVVLFLCARALAWLALFFSAGKFITLLPGALYLTAEKNFLFAFSLPLPLAVSLLLSGLSFLILTYFFFRAEGQQWWLVLGYALISSGGFSNFFERLNTGFVWDYLVIEFFGLRGVWNAADTLVLAGVGLWFWVGLTRFK